MFVIYSSSIKTFGDLSVCVVILKCFVILIIKHVIYTIMCCHIKW